MTEIALRSASAASVADAGAGHRGSIASAMEHVDTELVQMKGNTNVQPVTLDDVELGGPHQRIQEDEHLETEQGHHTSVVPQQHAFSERLDGEEEDEMKRHDGGNNFDQHEVEEKGGEDDQHQQQHHQQEGVLPPKVDVLRVPLLLFQVFLFLLLIRLQWDNSLYWCFVFSPLWLMEILLAVNEIEILSRLWKRNIGVSLNSFYPHAIPSVCFILDLVGIAATQGTLLVKLDELDKDGNDDGQVGGGGNGVSVTLLLLPFWITQALRALLFLKLPFGITEDPQTCHWFFRYWREEATTARFILVTLQPFLICLQLDGWLHEGSNASAWQYVFIPIFFIVALSYIILVSSFFLMRMTAYYPAYTVIMCYLVIPLWLFLSIAVTLSCVLFVAGDYSAAAVLIPVLAGVGVLIPLQLSSPYILHKIVVASYMMDAVTVARAQQQDEEQDGQPHGGTVEEYSGPSLTFMRQTSTYFTRVTSSIIQGQEDEERQMRPSLLRGSISERRTEPHDGRVVWHGSLFSHGSGAGGGGGRDSVNSYAGRRSIDPGDVDGRQYVLSPAFNEDNYESPLHYSSPGSVRRTPPLPLRSGLRATERDDISRGGGGCGGGGGGGERGSGRSGSSCGGRGGDGGGGDRGSRGGSSSSAKVAAKESLIKRLPSLSARAKICIICMEQPADSVIMDCGHGGICFDCGKQLAAITSSQLCPVCRGPIASVIKIHEEVTAAGTRILKGTEGLTITRVRDGGGNSGGGSGSTAAVSSVTGASGGTSFTGSYSGVGSEIGCDGSPAGDYSGATTGEGGGGRGGGGSTG